MRQKIDPSLEQKSFVESGFKRALVQTSRCLRGENSFSFQIDKAWISSHIDENCKGSHLVFVDGVLRLDLSDLSSLPKACAILPTSKALKIYGPILSSRYKIQKQDPLEIFNLAHFQEGVVIYVPGKLCVENPLQIILLASHTEAQSIALPRIDLMLGKESVLDVLLSTPSLEIEGAVDTQDLTIASLQASLDEGAKLSICDALFSKAGSIHFCEFLLRKEAKVSMWSANYYSLVHALHCSALLEGERAHFEIKGISTLHPYAQTMTKVLAEHKARETTSHQNFKQILSTGAKSTFEGKIYVHPEALLTDAYQRSAALLLSDHAYAISRPNLEIFADDVKASHGATMTTLRDEEAHYLRTRGLSEQEAKNLLIEGFAKTIIQDVPYTQVHQELQSALQMFASTPSKA